MSARLIPYRPIDVHSAREWDAEHLAGDWDYLDRISELARYSLISGYIRFLAPVGTILDIGCGQGTLVEHLSGINFTSYVGVDISGAAILRARERTAAHDRVSFVVGDTLPSGPDRFHFIVCNESLYYLERPDIRLRELSGILEPDGYFLTSIWHHRGHLALRRLIGKSFDLVAAVEVASLPPVEKTLTQVACWRQRGAGSARRAPAISAQFLRRRLGFY